MLSVPTSKRTSTTASDPVPTGIVYRGAAGLVEWDEDKWNEFYTTLPGIRWVRDAGADVIMYNNSKPDGTTIEAIRFNVNPKSGISLASKPRRKTK